MSTPSPASVPHYKRPKQHMPTGIPNDEHPKQHMPTGIPNDEHPKQHMLVSRYVETYLQTPKANLVHIRVVMYQQETMVLAEIDSALKKAIICCRCRWVIWVVEQDYLAAAAERIQVGGQESELRERCVLQQ
eukprot:1158838-Pelagomonas_calceolata.AAC.6